MTHRCCIGSSFIPSLFIKVYSRVQKHSVDEMVAQLTVLGIVMTSLSGGSCEELSSEKSSVVAGLVRSCQVTSLV